MFLFRDNNTTTTTTSGKPTTTTQGSRARNNDGGEKEENEREKERAVRERDAHLLAQRLMTAKQRNFISYEESEYKKHLAELDTALTAAIPQAGVPFHTHDLAYKSSSTPVRYLFELPVPVDTAGAHVSYRFATDEYDISFGVFFQGLDGHTETVLPSARVDSHYEPCSGDVTVHRPGTVILMWDNTYSWFSSKSLSYSVHLRYPTGETAEKERTHKARQVLDAAYHDIANAESKSTAVNAQKATLASDVGKLEEQLALLQADLEEKKKELHTLEEDSLLLSDALYTRTHHLLPLLLRALPSKALLNLASYFTHTDHIHTVNHLFLQLFIQSRPGYTRPPSLSVSASSSTSPLNNKGTHTHPPSHPPTHTQTHTHKIQEEEVLSSSTHPSSLSIPVNKDVGVGVGVGVSDTHTHTPVSPRGRTGSMGAE